MGNIPKTMQEIVEKGGHNNKKNSSFEPEQDQSHFEAPLDGIVTEDETENDPFNGRVVGKNKKEFRKESAKYLYTARNIVLSVEKDLTANASLKNAIFVTNCSTISVSRAM